MLRQMLGWSSSISLLTLLLAIAPAQANCNDRVAELGLVQPLMMRHWRQLQQQTQFPWGTIQPYDTIQGNRITLTSDFDRLTGPQKQQVLELLRLGGGYYNGNSYPGPNWYSLAGLEEKPAIVSNPGMGAISPYEVYTNDGRPVSVVYDGCTRETLLTEKARFGWYLHQHPPGLEEARKLWLRNVGQTPWRRVRFPIAPAPEKAVRTQFWKAIGMDTPGWWIAWVPEQGYFEINLPTGTRNLSGLQQFWRTAPKQYRYRVVNSDGTVLQQRDANP